MSIEKALSSRVFQIVFKTELTLPGPLRGWKNPQEETKLRRFLDVLTLCLGMYDIP